MIAVVSVACAATGHAQDLARTKAWIESEAPRILETTTATESGTFRSGVHDFTLDAENCMVSWQTHNGLQAQVPLRDLDTRGVIVRASELFSTPVTLLRLRTLDSVGPTIVGWNMGTQGKVDSIEMQVRSAEDGERLADAFGRAAVLCGAPSPPS